MDIHYCNDLYGIKNDWCFLLARFAHIKKFSVKEYDIKNTKSFGIFKKYLPLFIFIVLGKISKKSGISYENAIAIGFATTAKNHGITLALAMTAFGGLSVLPPSTVPMFQVLLMMFIWKISPKIRSYYCKKDF